MMRAGDVVIIAIVVAFGTEAVAGNAIETLTQFNYMPVFEWPATVGARGTEPG